MEKNDNMSVHHALEKNLSESSILTAEKKKKFLLATFGSEDKEKYVGLTSHLKVQIYFWSAIKRS